MFTPPAVYHRRARKKGLNGYDVAVVQLNLRALGVAVGGSYFELSKLVVDGAFGPKTEEAVRRYQSIKGHASLGDADGVDGYLTDRAIAIDCMRPSEDRYHTPRGLEKGICEGEAGFDPAAFVREHGERGPYIDTGFTMEHLESVEMTEDRFKAAFDGLRAFDKLGQRLRKSRDRFSTAAGPAFVPSGRERPWWCAILEWNWPFAAQHYADGEGNFTYYERLLDGTKVLRHMRDDAEWVKRIGVVGVTTGEAWAKHYVSSKTTYVSADGWTT